MNHLENVSKLNNRYILQRHGRSLANEQGIIISDPQVGTVAFGLVAEGRTEARRSAGWLKSRRFFNRDKAIIFSSDFKRARETAEESRGVLGSEIDIVATPALRERNFGGLEQASN